MIVLPVGHEQLAVRRLPWVTFGIMALCFLTFLFWGRSASTSAVPDEVTAWIDGLMQWGLVPARPNRSAFLTYMFLHAGWYHLLGNLLILYLAGPFIEDVWGRPLFAGFYLLAGLSAAAFHVAFNPGAATPMVGASGAIAGVLGAFLVRHGTTRIRFFYLIMWLVRGTFSMPAWVLLPLWFAHQIVLGVLDPGSGVAYWAHVGGFTAGVAAALAIGASHLERRFIEPALRTRIDTPVLSNPAVENGLAIRAEGNAALALARLRHAVECEPGNPDAACAYWTVAEERGQQAQAAPLLLRSIARQLRDGDHDSALNLWVEILQGVPAVRAETPLLLNLGRLLDEHDRKHDARATLRKALEQHGPASPPNLALRLARIAQVLDPPLALSALALALGNPGLDAASRVEAEALRSRLTPIEIAGS